mmetsp:Transcript_3164/g.10389  ORF Transcript_3164/g.10389 Transcript_3164/m.10389 type:complete len:224 (+) Transcript_3164:902-1573(+)
MPLFTRESTHPSEQSSQSPPSGSPALPGHRGDPSLASPLHATSQKPLPTMSGAQPGAQRPAQSPSSALHEATLQKLLHTPSPRKDRVHGRPPWYSPFTRLHVFCSQSPPSCSHATFLQSESHRPSPFHAMRHSGSCEQPRQSPKSHTHSSELQPASHTPLPQFVMLHEEPAAMAHALHASASGGSELHSSDSDGHDCLHSESHRPFVVTLIGHVAETVHRASN